MHWRLKKARIDAGFPTATAAIDHFGWKGSTYRAHENGQNEFDASTAKAYAKAYGKSPGWLLTGDEPPTAARPAPPSRSMTNAFEQDAASPKIFVTGRAALGEWLEEVVRKRQEENATESPFPPDPNFPLEAQFDLRVSGAWLNRFAHDGDLLRCVDLGVAQIDVEDGDLVVIERKRDGGLSEISARRLRRLGDRFEFRCESDDPVWEGLVLVKEAAKGVGDDIRILAKVLWKYQKA